MLTAHLEALGNPFSITPPAFRFRVKNAALCRDAATPARCWNCLRGAHHRMEI